MGFFIFYGGKYGSRCGTIATPVGRESMPRSANNVLPATTREVTSAHGAEKNARRHDGGACPAGSFFRHGAKETKAPPLGAEHESNLAGKRLIFSPTDTQSKI